MVENHDQRLRTRWHTECGRVAAQSRHSDDDSSKCRVSIRNAASVWRADSGQVISLGTLRCVRLTDRYRQC